MLKIVLKPSQVQQNQQLHLVLSLKCVQNHNNLEEIQII